MSDTSAAPSGVFAGAFASAALSGVARARARARQADQRRRILLLSAGSIRGIGVGWHTARITAKQARPAPGAPPVARGIDHGPAYTARAGRRQYWLLATDPDEYSFSDLERDTETVWDGVTDYSSLKTLRDVEPGEEALIFHTGTEMAIVGIAASLRTPIRRHGQQCRGGRRGSRPVRRLERPVLLAEIEDLPEFRIPT